MGDLGKWSRSQFNGLLRDQVAVSRPGTEHRGRGSGVEVEGRESALWTSSRRQGLSAMPGLRTGRSPRSRRAVGVGDVAGERGGRAALVGGASTESGHAPALSVR